MSHAFELEFQTDFQEQIIHAIRDHIDHYDQQNISFIIADYLTIQNQKATNAKIVPIQAKVEELEASWNRILTKDIGYTLDKWKKIFIELAKNRAILQALQEKKSKDDDEDTTRKRKRDEEIREAAEKKKRDEYTQWLVKHPKTSSSSPSSSTAPLPQMPSQFQENFQSMMMQLMAQYYMPQQMVPSSTPVEDIKADIKHQPTRILSQNATSPWQNSTRPSSGQSMASTNNDVSPFALSRSSSRTSNLSNQSTIDVTKLGVDLRDLDIQNS